MGSFGISVEIEEEGKEEENVCGFLIVLLSSMMADLTSERVMLMLLKHTGEHVLTRVMVFERRCKIFE